MSMFGWFWSVQDTRSAAPMQNRVLDAQMSYVNQITVKCALQYVDVRIEITKAIHLACTSSIPPC